MIVVGSRSGGYDFYAKIGEIRIWLGCDQNSDLDVFSDRRPEIHTFTVDWIGTERWFLDRLLEGNLNIWRGVARPWRSNDGHVHIPPNFDFLSIAIRKKLRNNNIDWRRFIGHKCQIFNSKNKKKVSEIVFQLIF